MTTKRRQTTQKERLTPCECCKHPLSQRHHLLNVAYHGENDFTVQLCANCHELYHLIYNKYVLKSKTAKLGFILLKLKHDKRISYLYNLVVEVANIEKELTVSALREIEEKK